MSRTLGKMFDPDDAAERLAGEHQFVDALANLRPVEEFFCEAIKGYQSEGSFDCSAAQPFPFWTINYTSLAGCFMMHPLQNELRCFQVQSALFDCALDGIDYVGYFADRVRLGVANKYKDRIKPQRQRLKSLVVLPGQNVLEKAVNINTLRWVIEEQGKFAGIKPHPLTDGEAIQALKSQLLPVANFLGPDDDLYAIIRNVEEVYTTHHSETALMAACIGKPIKPISDYRHRMSGAFAHINDLLFYSMNPKGLINQMLSSYKSGIVHPDLQRDWQDRIIRYLDYIHALRSHMKNASK